MSFNVKLLIVSTFSITTFLNLIVWIVIVPFGGGVNFIDPPPQCF
jgi:hypothetical protein